MCDRPGCDNRVTPKGLVSAGLAVGRDDGPIGGVVFHRSDDGPMAVTHTAGTDPLELQSNNPPDLCRECVKSLATWWTALDRRRSKTTEHPEPKPEPSEDPKPKARRK